MNATARVIHLVPAPGWSDTPLRVRSPRAPAAFEERIARALERYLPFVWRVLRRMGLSRAEASRALGRVFGALAEQPRLSRAAELPVLVGAAVRVASKRRRTSRRDAASEPSHVDDEGMPWEEEAEVRESLLLIDAALSALHAPQRAVFVLVELEGMTRGQVGAALQLPRSTVAARLERARLEFALAARRLLDESSYRAPRLAPLSEPERLGLRSAAR